MYRSLLLLVCAIALLLFARESHHPVEAGVPEISENGDVNGDGGRDIGDAVYLLSWLFQGGPEPVALAGSSDLETRLEDLEDTVARLHGADATLGGLASSTVRDLEAQFIIDHNWDWEVWNFPAHAFAEADPRAKLSVSINRQATGDVLALRRSEAIEAVGRIDVIVTLPSATLPARSLIGGSLEATYSTNPPLVLRGEVTSFALTALTTRRAVYHITAYDRTHRLSRGRKSRSFVEQSDSDIISIVLDEAGMEADSRVEGTLSSITHDHVYQNNQTDLEFLNERARASGLWWMGIDDADGTTVRFSDGASGRIPRDTGTGTIRYNGHGPIAAGATGISSLQRGSRMGLSRVTVRGWDPVDKKPIVGTASRRSGLGEDDEHGVNARDASTLQEIAAARLEAHQAEAESFSGTSNVSHLRAGQLFRIEAIGTQFDGEVFVTSVRHQFVSVDTPQGTKLVYGNQFRGRPSSTATRPHLEVSKNAARTTSTTITAIVISGPDELGRVKVRFPWSDAADGNGDSARIRVAQNHSASGTTAFLPEIDDEVLVSFEQGDPNRPVIVGRLWNGVDQPPRPR